MPPKTKTLTQKSLERLGMSPKDPIYESASNFTYTIKAHHNTPKVDTTVEERQIAEGDLVAKILDYQPRFRSIEVMCEQTGEIIYHRYANLDFYESGCEWVERAE